MQGVIAGKLSKAGLAGYVGAVPVPEVVQGINAFMLGMQSVNPKARLKFIMINSWYDPPKEGDAAKALIDQGCDVLTQHTRLPGAAAGRGQPRRQGIRPIDRYVEVRAQHAAFGQHRVWGPYYVKRIQDVLDGTWKSTDTWGGFAAAC